MKKGNLTGTQVILAILTLIVILVIIVGVGPLFNQVSNLFGFGVDLTPEEIAVQEQAKSQIETNLIQNIYDCKSKNGVACFCGNKSLTLPTDYVLSFSSENNEMKIGLVNNKGGKVENYNLNNIQPCISDELWNLASLDTQTKNGNANLIFGSTTYLTYQNIQGNDVKKAIDPAYFVFKPNQDTICIIDQDAAKIRMKTVCN